MSHTTASPDGTTLRVSDEVLGYSAREASRARATMLPLALLGAITLLGLAVRLFGLTSYGIWFDEAYHIQLVQLPSVADMLDAVLSNPPSAPLYVLLLRAWSDVFGTSDGAVRMLSVLLSTAALPATYWLGRVVAGRAVGLVGALLLALSPYAVELGQEAALYVLASLLTTLALAAGLALRATGRGWPLYLALGVLAMYSHYVVAAILPLLALLTMLPQAGPRRVGLRTWLAVNAGIVAAWLPWLLAMAFYWQASELPRATLSRTGSVCEVVNDLLGASVSESVRATVCQVLGALVQFSSGTAALLQGERLLAVLGLVSGVVLLVAGLLAARSPGRRTLAVIAMTSAVIFFVPAVLSMLTGLWLFVPHFMVFLLPSMLVVLAAGYSLRAVPRDPIVAHGTTRYVVPGALSVAIALWLVAQVWGLALFYRHSPHGADGLRELAAVLRSETQPGDSVFVTPPSLMATLRQYYSGVMHGLPRDFDLRRLYSPHDPERWYADSVSRLRSAAAERSRFWLVYHRSELDEGGRLLATLKRDYRLVEERSFSYADLYLFDVP